MSTKLSPNDPCPCGSGKKVKKCCKARRPFGSVTEHDRARFFELLEAYVFTVLDEDFAATFADLWEDLGGRIEDLDDHSRQVSLEVTLMWFALDAPLDDLPELVEQRLDFGDATPVRSLFAEPGSHPRRRTPARSVRAADRARSAGDQRDALRIERGVEPVLRTPTVRTSTPKRGATPTLTSEDVYYLPGAIDIRQVHAIETLSRIGAGREALQRSLVRGHWRRAAKNWSDPRPRWIAPYWKGPDMAAVIERAYRLRA